MGLNLILTCALHLFKKKEKKKGQEILHVLKRQINS